MSSAPSIIPCLPLTKVAPSAAPQNLAWEHWLDHSCVESESFLRVALARSVSKKTLCVKGSRFRVQCGACANNRALVHTASWSLPALSLHSPNTSCRCQRINPWFSISAWLLPLHEMLRILPRLVLYFYFNFYLNMSFLKQNVNDASTPLTEQVPLTLYSSSEDIQVNSNFRQTFRLVLFLLILTKESSWLTCTFRKFRAVNLKL